MANDEAPASEPNASQSTETQTESQAVHRCRMGSCLAAGFLSAQIAQAEAEEHLDAILAAFAVHVRRALPSIIAARDRAQLARFGPMKES